MQAKHQVASSNTEKHDEFSTFSFPDAWEGGWGHFRLGRGGVEGESQKLPRNERSQNGLAYSGKS